LSFSILNRERETELKSQLEVVARIGAIILILFYITGFLVVSFADASRGIVGFGFLRAKILTAGILFSVFVMLPLIDWSRVFGKLGFPDPPIDTLAVRVEEATAPEHRTIPFRVVKLFKFIMSSLPMALFICWFVLLSVPSVKFFAFYVVFIGIGVTVFMLFAKHPVASALLSLVLTAAGIAGLIFLKQDQIGILLAWFFFVGYAAHTIESDIRRAQHARNVNWHWVLLSLVLPIGFFSLWLYPKITPSLGGGQPSQVVFQFAGQSPIDGLTKNQLWMLDEVDAGYYVLRDPNEHKAVFIPRGLVSAIYFEADQIATSKTK
jgi:hypothetical protein